MIRYISNDVESVFEFDADDLAREIMAGYEMFRRTGLVNEQVQSCRYAVSATLPGISLHVASDIADKEIYRSLALHYRSAYSYSQQRDLLGGL